jgi:Sec-independent protein translocase protein TatA
MALDILEWGSIAVMVIGIFIWGPEKVPAIMKTLGGARRDLESYTKQFQGITKELTTAAGTGNIDSLMGTLTGLAGSSTKTEAGSAAQAEAAGAGAAGAVAQDPSGDKLLVDMAKKLEISTQGKTRDQIQSEIVAKASRGPATSVDATQVQPAQESTSAPTAEESSVQEPAGAPGAQESPAQSPAAS